MKLELKPIPQPAPPMEYHLILNEDEMKYIKCLSREVGGVGPSFDPEKCFK